MLFSLRGKIQTASPWPSGKFRNGAPKAQYTPPTRLNSTVESRRRRRCVSGLKLLGALCVLYQMKTRALYNVEHSDDMAALPGRMLHVFQSLFPLVSQTCSDSNYSQRWTSNETKVNRNADLPQPLQPHSSPCYLFAKIRHNPHHVLYKLLHTDKNDHTYSLRPRCHSFSLTVKTDSRNYINRMLSKTFRLSVFYEYCVVAFCQCVLLKRD